MYMYGACMYTCMCACVVRIWCVYVCMCGSYMYVYGACMCALCVLGMEYALYIRRCVQDACTHVCIGPTCAR